MSSFPKALLSVDITMALFTIVICLIYWIIDKRKTRKGITNYRLPQLFILTTIAFTAFTVFFTIALLINDFLQN